MKNLLLGSLLLLFLTYISSCITEKVEPMETAAKFTKTTIDTIVTFDPQTKTETIQYLAREEDDEIDFTNLNLNSDEYRTDTIITFNPDTYEETIQIVRTKVTN